MFVWLLGYSFSISSSFAPRFFSVMIFGDTGVFLVFLGGGFVV